MMLAKIRWILIQKLLLFSICVVFVRCQSNIDEGQCFYADGKDALAPDATPKICDKELYYQWRLLKYEGYLATEPSFWRYQAQSQFQLTNGLALDFAVQKCKAKLENLKDFRTGRHGPVDPQNAWKSMCHMFCQYSDQIHYDALCYSGCTCMTLSTQRNEPSWTKDGDWCSHNSARMLCETIGFCGIWECKIDDFMCPRHEYNKKVVSLKGYGNCDRFATHLAAASSGYSTISMIMLGVFSISIIFITQWIS